MVTPIESVEDLARQTEIKYGVVRGGSTQAFFDVIIFISNENEFVFSLNRNPMLKLFNVCGHICNRVMMF
jgi:hypothetical protein